MRKFTYLTHKDKKQKKWKTQKSIKHTLNPSFPFSLFFVLFKKSRKKNQEKNHGAAPRGALFALRSQPSLLCLGRCGFSLPKRRFWERKQFIHVYILIYTRNILLLHWLKNSHTHTHTLSLSLFFSRSFSNVFKTK